MKQDLNTLKLEFERALKEGEFVIFRGAGRPPDTPLTPIYWDAARHADPQGFLAVAAALGVKVIVFHDEEFSSEEIEEAFERLEEASLGREEAREIERNLKKLKAYVGFTCAIEVSFDYQHETYMYDITTSWYDEFLEIMEGLDDPFGGDAEEGPGPMGYFSHN